MPLIQNRYLIIDYGSHSIKGLLCESGPLAERVLRMESLPIIRLESLAESSPQQLFQASRQSRKSTLSESKEPEEKDNPSFWNEYEYNLMRFVQSFFPEESSYILGLPLYSLHIRDFTLPAVKPKQTAQTIAFEAEESLPFSLENTEVVGHPWSSNGKNMQILSFGAARDLIENLSKSLLNEHGIILGLFPDASMLSCFLRAFGAEFYQGRCIGQLNIGAKHTIFNVVHNGKLAFSRSLPYGGNDLDAIAAEVLQIDQQTAEQKRIQWDMNLLDLRPCPEDFYKKHSLSKTVYNDILLKSREWLNKLCLETDRSLLGLRCPPPDCFYMSGGVSLTRGLPVFIGEKLQKSVEKYPVSLSNEAKPELWATAMGAKELQHLTNTERDNFLDTPFGSTLKGGQISLGVFKTPFIFSAVSLLIFILSFTLGIARDTARSKKNKEEIQALSKNIPGLLASDASPDQILIQTQEICQKRLRGSNKSLIRVLDIIQEIDKGVPPPDKMDLVFRNLQFDGKAVQLEVELLNVGQSVDLQEEFKKGGGFAVVEVKRRKILPNQRARITYRLESRQKQGGLNAGGSCL